MATCSSLCCLYSKLQLTVEATEATLSPVFSFSLYDLTIPSTPLTPTNAAVLMATIIPIVMAVKRHVQYKKMQNNLHQTQEELQMAAEERRLMREEFEAYRAETAAVNAQNNSRDDSYGGEYEYVPNGTPATNVPAQPVEVPVQGVPMQQAYAPAQAYPGQPAPVMMAANQDYCRRCNRYHAVPMCRSPTRKERREARREERRERREERREERRDRRQRSPGIIRRAVGAVRDAAKPSHSDRRPSN